MNRRSHRTIAPRQAMIADAELRFPGMITSSLNERTFTCGYLADYGLPVLATKAFPKLVGAEWNFSGCQMPHGDTALDGEPRASRHPYRLARHSRGTQHQIRRTPDSSLPATVGKFFTCL